VSRRVLSDELWERIEPLVPAMKGPMGRPFRDHRQVIEGVVYRYRYRAGIAWRDLPGEFGPWQTAWKRHRRFSSDGTWDDILRCWSPRPTPRCRWTATTSGATTAG
jgi:transposase